MMGHALPLSLFGLIDRSRACNSSACRYRLLRSNLNEDPHVVHQNSTPFGLPCRLGARSSPFPYRTSEFTPHHGQKIAFLI